MLYQELAVGLRSLFVTQGSCFPMCATGEVGQMISKFKLPLNGSKRRFWFVSLHFTVIYITPTLPNNVHPGTTLESTSQSKQPRKGARNQEKEYVHTFMSVLLFVFSIQKACEDTLDKGRFS